MHWNTVCVVLIAGIATANPLDTTNNPPEGGVKSGGQVPPGVGAGGAKEGGPAIGDSGVRGVSVQSLGAPDRVVPISHVYYNNPNTGEGSYSYGYDTGIGLKKDVPEGPSESVKGSFIPEGQVIRGHYTHYTGGKDGFLEEGSGVDKSDGRYDTGISLKKDVPEGPSESVKGSYSYSSPDGQVIRVHYTPDTVGKDGFLKEVSGVDKSDGSFDSGSGIKAQEQAYSKPGVPEDSDGGFSVPLRAHLLTPRPIPEAIRKALEKNAADEAAGIVDDGKYKRAKGSRGSPGSSFVSSD